MKETESLRDARELLRSVEGGDKALSLIENAWDEECRGAGLYPQAIFHFTDKKGLFGILESNFKICFSLERIECFPASGGGLPEQTSDSKELPINREFGAPMVSFCDLRMSELRVHMRDYGSYGIGMSKEWAIRSGVNPVYYISARAGLLEEYISSMSELFNRLDSGQCSEQTYHRLLNFYRYLKNYEAPLYRKGRLTRDRHRFANEREWRYVPPIEGDLTAFASKDFIVDADNKREWNKGYESTPLVFQPNDVRYVIVKTDDERDEVLRHIRRAKKKYSASDVKRLQSRILTADQISEDV